MFDDNFFNKEVSSYTQEEISEMVQALKRIYGNTPEYYSYDGILKRMLSRVDDTMDKRFGSIIYDALAPCAAELAEEYIEIQIYRDQTYLLDAVGENLDRKGADFTILRETATQAERLGELIDTSGNLINLPIGSRFSVPESDMTITFYIKGYISTGKPIFVCEQAGTAGNEYYGELLPLFAINNLKEAKITGIQKPAQNDESDDDYRARIISRLNSKSFGGNIADYKQYVDDISGTSEPKVFPVWNGGGTVKISVLDSQYNAITDEFKQQIKEIIDPEEYSGQGMGTAPIGHVVTVSTPTNTTVNIKAQVVLDSVSLGQIKTDVEENLENYFLSVRRTWANSEKTNIFISQVIAAILQTAGVKNVTNVELNDLEEDITLEDTAQEQFIPILGEVTLYE